MLLSKIEYIYYVILFKCRKSPIPESMLFVVKETLEGGGRGTQRKGIGMFTVQKRAIYRSVSGFVSHCG